MTSLRWTSAKLGIFTVFTVITTLWLAAVIGNLRPFSSPYRLTAEFTDATGLQPGDVVKAAGVGVGRVDGIRIVDGLAVVTMSIDDGTRLPAPLRAEIRFRNLIGQRMITLASASTAASHELTRPGDRIPLERTSPAFDLTALFNGIRPLLRSTTPHDINIVSRELVKALRGRGAQVAALFDHVADVSATVASRDQELSTLLKNVNSVASDLAGRDRQLRTTLADINVFLGKIAATRADLAQAVQTLGGAAARLRRVVAANRSNITHEVKDLAALLGTIDKRKADLRGAIRALPSMLTSVERVNSYGEWAMLHLVNACRDDSGRCGRRGLP